MKIVRATIDLFGAARCMFTSNCPVDNLCATFATIFDGFRGIVATFADGAARASSATTRFRIYAMTVSQGGAIIRRVASMPRQSQTGQKNHGFTNE